MKIIANETVYAQRSLNHGYIDKKKVYKSIRTVVRYLKNKCDIKDIDIMIAIIQDYISNTGVEVSIDELTIKAMMNEETPYYELESVNITKKELDTITNLKYPQYPHSYKKILFAMLVQYKVKKELLGVSNNRIEREASEILGDAHVSLTKTKQMEMWRQFLEDGLISIEDGGKKAKYVYLNYIDDSYDASGLEVRDLEFAQYYLYFEKYVKGGRLYTCPVCGKLVLSKVKNLLYCDKCSHDRKKDRQRIAMREKREAK